MPGEDPRVWHDELVAVPVKYLFGEIHRSAGSGGQGIPALGKKNIIPGPTNACWQVRYGEYTVLQGTEACQGNAIAS